MRYFKRAGSDEVEVMSESRTASPNTRWPAEQLAKHGFTEVPEPKEIAEEAEKERLIAEKQRDLAISALKAEGKLDSQGKVK
jgi:hypothetical protein